MSKDHLPKSLHDYIERPKDFAEDDFFEQVRRTIDGKPIDAQQLAFIHSMIDEALDVSNQDILLDLCCGNGALTSVLHNKLKGYLGVDISDYLISVANKYFAPHTTVSYLTQEMVLFVNDCKNCHTFTKALWYGAFAYFSEKDALYILKRLYTRFTSIDKIFIGSIPDLNQFESFNKGYPAIPVDDHTSSIGRWYNPDDLIEMINSIGWHTEKTSIPGEFYQSHYRFNVLLYR